MKLTKRKDGRYCTSRTINGERVFFYSSEPTEKKAERDIENQMLAYQGKIEKGRTLQSVADEWENDFARYVKLRGNNGEEVSVTTMKISETLVSDFDTENMERRSVFIHGKEVSLYEEKTEEYSTISVAWTDEDKGQLIHVWGRGIAVDEFISIANGVYAGNE